MRVLVATTAGAGHFGPLVPLARACLAAGHEVAVAAPASFSESVASAGLTHLPFADVPDEVMGPVFGRLPSMSAEEADEVVVTEVFGRLDAQAALPGVTAIFAEWRPDVVLREQCELASLVVAEATGVPHAVVAIGVRAFDHHVQPLLASPLAELDVLAGVPVGTSAAATRAAPTLTSVPAGLDGPPLPPGGGVTHRYRDDLAVADRGRLPGPWGDPSHPLVYVSFGSVAAGVGGFAGIYPAVVAAFAGRPVRVLLTTGQGVDLGDPGALPDNVHVERWWPQADVMPHAAVVVGHGGFGTTMAAVAAGVPQVIVPLFSFDQHMNAEHVAAAGAGVHLEGGVAVADAVPEAVERILAEAAYHRAARLLADEIAGHPPVSEVVGQLEALAGRGC